MTPATAAPPQEALQASTKGRELSARDHSFVSLRGLLQAKQKEILAALPKHIQPAYFMRVVLTALQRNPQLLECDPITFLGAVLQCAQLGLVPDGFLGQAYLIPYKNNKRTPPRYEVQFQPGYKGLVALTRRSGEVSTIHADIVHQKDHFKYIRGFNPQFEHMPTEEEDPGPWTKAYAWYRLRDGGFDIHVMTKREVYKIRDRSQAYRAGVQYNRKDSPWFTDEEAMAKKTCLKQLLKLAPMSTEIIARASGLDDAAEIGLPQDLALLADPEAEPTALLDGDSVDEETGEVLEMPQRISTQQPPPPQPNPEPPPPPPPPSLAAGALIDCIVDAGQVGTGWAAHTEGGLRVWTRDPALGAQLVAAKGQLRRITADPADAQGRRKLTGLEA